MDMPHRWGGMPLHVAIKIPRLTARLNIPRLNGATFKAKPVSIPLEVLISFLACVGRQAEQDRAAEQQPVKLVD